MKTKLLLLLSVCIGMTSSAWALEKEGDIYQIGTAQDLRDFATAVNEGEYGAFAVLTANIDLNNEAWTPIGNATNPYTGTFDGEGYAITNFSYTATGPDNGLFGHVKNATIKNFSISGALTSDGFTNNGTIGAAEGSTIIKGIYSALNITVKNFKAHSGGILGSTVTSGNTVRVENCEYSGTLTHSGTGDCQAGILGYTYDGGVFNCIFSGTIIGESSKYGGILGYCKVPNFLGVQNCLSIGKIVANEGCTTAAAIIANWNGNATSNVKNNYYCFAEGSTTTIAIGNKATSCEAPIAVTAERLASGEVCYLLNGDQSSIAFYQTLDVDAVPVLDATHKSVYLAGRIHCDGTPYEGVLGYSNIASIVDDHTFVDGFCSLCGVMDKTYMTANDKGYFEIGTPAQLVWFAAYVNAGNPASNAVLTADIDMTGKSWAKPIGDWSSGKVSTAFAGNFNGQGHAITGLVYTTKQSYHGFFGVTTTGTLIENFSIAGTVTNEDFGQFGGVVGYARDNTTIIRNVKSAMNFVNKKAGQRIGGIVGQANNGTTRVENCVYSGILSPGNATGNYGGIVGYVNNNVNANLFIINCLFDGEINNIGADGECGGIAGYVGANPNVTIENCLSVGYVSSNRAGLICGTIQANNSVVENNYYLGEAANGPTSTVERPSTEVTAEQLASGEVAYKLGDAWGQVLGTDQVPSPQNENAVNYVGEAGYATMYDTTTGYELNGDVKAYVGVVAKDDYIALTEVDNIPASTAVVLKGTYYNKIAADLQPINIVNELKGTAVDTEATGSQYVLAKPENEEVGFYQATTGTIKAGKAYLELPSTEVKAFYFGGENETAIVSPLEETKEGVAIYNIAGQRISKMQKGVNIVSGHKVLF